jgi:hypothetical protein
MDHYLAHVRALDSIRASIPPTTPRDENCLMVSSTAPCAAWRAAQGRIWNACFNSNGSRKTNVPHGECDCMFSFENALRTQLSAAGVSPASGVNLLDTSLWNGNTQDAQDAIRRAADAVVCSLPQCQSSASATCVQPDVVRLRQRSQAACHRTSSCSLRLGSSAETSGLSDAACASAARGCGWSSVQTCAELQAASASGGPACPATHESSSSAPSGGVEPGRRWRPACPWVLLLLLACVSIACACLYAYHRSRHGRVVSVARR